MSPRKTMPSPAPITPSQKMLIDSLRVVLGEVLERLDEIQHVHLDDSIQALRKAVESIDGIQFRDLTNPVPVIDGPKRRNRRK